jgi:adenylate cyclase
MVNTLKLQAMLHWLATGAPPQSDYRTTFGELCRRMQDIGVQADLVSIYQIALNPLLGGLRYSWSPSQGVTMREFTHEMMASELFIDGVIHAAKVHQKPVRYYVGKMPEFDTHPGSQRIINAGYKEFSVSQLRTTTNADTVLAIATRNPEGFPEEQFDAYQRIIAPLARVVQSQIQTDSTNALLSAYLGRDAGMRVNAGMVKRGDAEMIRAVIVFTDIVGFTALSNRLPIEATVRFLNNYVEALETPIIKNGGEILKMIGDGVLAIFPTPHDITAQEGAALSALSAVEDARALLAEAETPFRASYHIGDVHYGNIGGLSRLDFTAIGPAVNLAARLLDAASNRSVEATGSAAFARLVPHRARPLGIFDFKGFETAEEVFDLS